MSGSSFKKIVLYDPKKGPIQIGKLSKNELCRGISTLINEGQTLSKKLNLAAMQYANHMASIDAMSEKEREEYWQLK